MRDPYGRGHNREGRRAAAVAAGSTRRPFEFYLAGAVLYLVLTALSDVLFRLAERRAAQKTLHRGTSHRRAAQEAAQA